MVKTSSRPHGSQDNGHCMTCAAQEAIHTHGRGQHGAQGGRQPSAMALVSAPFLGLALTHKVLFSFMFPQPLHNWHNEPGYLFYSQPAASSQLQVRCHFLSTCYMPGFVLSILPCLAHLILTTASSS